MKTTLRTLLGAVLALVALLLVNLAFEPGDAHAAINRNEPLPVTWADAYGTNAFSLSYQAKPVLTINGTNYTGISTNFAATNQLRLNIVNGLVVGINGL